MHVANRQTARRYERTEGIVSFLLLSRIDGGSRHLTTTLVEVEPGGRQRLHSHAPEQVYFIVEGRGIMRVGEEEREVVEGDCVFVPSGETHGIVNAGAEPLRYFSAAAPSFDEEELRSLWPLPPESRSLTP